MKNRKNNAMYFEEGYIYHIYNQGNNRQMLFFNRDNYLFFLRKIKIHLLPYVDVLAWCLMPNHFHLMVLVNSAELPIPPTEGLVSAATEGFAHSETLGEGNRKTRSLNFSIGLMLRSYTNAINKQRKLSGSLFRKNTKAECINCPTGLTPSFITSNGVTYFNNEQPERQYPQVCFNYIHQNPVKAGLVSRAEEWEFSSAVDYTGLRDGKLISREVAELYVDIGSNRGLRL